MRSKDAETMYAKWYVLTVVLLMTCGFIFMAPPGYAEFLGPDGDNDDTLKYRPGYLLVSFNPGTAKHRIDDIVAAAGATVEQYYDEVDAYYLKLSSVSVSESINAFAAYQEVEFAEPDYAVKIDEQIAAAKKYPNDPYFKSKKLWGMHNVGQVINGQKGKKDADIDAPEAWRRRNGTGRSSVVVAVIDTGVDYNHMDLKKNMWVNKKDPINGRDDDKNGYVDDYRGWDFYNNDNNPKDDHSHGTHCAGTIGGYGNNKKGVAGVAWRVKLMALKFLSATGSGYISGAIAAVNYTIKMKAHISNNSWGGGGYSAILKKAITKYGAKGGLFVAAAGNSYRDNDTVPHYPSSYTCSNILAVAATDNRDTKASFSNWGKKSVDVAAPGVDILSTEPGNSYGYKSGTSMATPHVSGVAALVKSRHWNWKHGAIGNRIKKTGDKKSSLTKLIKYGRRVNAYKANR